MEIRLTSVNLTSQNPIWNGYNRYDINPWETMVSTLTLYKSSETKNDNEHPNTIETGSGWRKNRTKERRHTGMRSDATGIQAGIF
jgi:hypothetical protein